MKTRARPPVSKHSTRHLRRSLLFVSKPSSQNIRRYWVTLQDVLSIPRVLRWTLAAWLYLRSMCRIHASIDYAAVCDDKAKLPPFDFASNISPRPLSHPSVLSTWDNSTFDNLERRTVPKKCYGTNSRIDAAWQDTPNENTYPEYTRCNVASLHRARCYPIELHLAASAFRCNPKTLYLRCKHLRCYPQTRYLRCKHLRCYPSTLHRDADANPGYLGCGRMCRGGFFVWVRYDTILVCSTPLLWGFKPLKRA